MDLYHSWIYIHILNTKWFIWSIVVMVFGFNFLGPILVWYIMNSKKLPIIKKIKQNTETK
ncbi:hypothetical protein [Bacillus sp. Marseille-P3661]|uniref:hypothetical protein n=1 Tax=Bacillus sp. Marseille-P3661 TaxID=1936234 RepID=UPI000C851710|nr:hypothetical protein [Bacillus sp. Marseille-P3661]